MSEARNLFPDKEGQYMSDDSSRVVSGNEKYIPMDEL